MKHFILLLTFAVLSQTLPLGGRSVTFSEDGNIVVTGPYGKRVVISRTSGMNGQRNMEISVTNPNGQTKRIQITDDNEIFDESRSGKDDDYLRTKRGSTVKTAKSSQGDLLGEILREYQGVVDDASYDKLMKRIDKSVQKGELSSSIYDILDGLNHKQETGVEVGGGMRSYYGREGGESGVRPGYYGKGGESGVRPSYYGWKGGETEVRPSYYGREAGESGVRPGYYGREGGESGVRPSYYERESGVRPGYYGRESLVRPSYYGREGESYYGREGVRPSYYGGEDNRFDLNYYGGEARPSYYYDPRFYRTGLEDYYYNRLGFEGYGPDSRGYFYNPSEYNRSLVQRPEFNFRQYFLDRLYPYRYKSGVSDLEGRERVVVPDDRYGEVRFPVVY